MEQFNSFNHSQKLVIFEDACKKKDTLFLESIIKEGLTAGDFFLHGKKMLEKICPIDNQELLELLLEKSHDYNQPISLSDNDYIQIISTSLINGNLNILKWVASCYDSHKCINHIYNTELQYSIHFINPKSIQWIWENRHRFSYEIDLSSLLKHILRKSCFFYKINMRELIEWLFNSLIEELGDLGIVCDKIITNDFFHECCLHYEVDVIEWLWEKSIQLNRPIDLQYMKYGTSFLNLACMADNVELAEWLWKKAIDVGTPYHINQICVDKYYIDNKNINIYRWIDEKLSNFSLIEWIKQTSNVRYTDIIGIIFLHGKICDIQWIEEKASEVGVEINYQHLFLEVLMEHVTRDNNIMDWIWDRAEEHNINLTNILGNHLFSKNVLRDHSKTKWLIEKCAEQQIELNYMSLLHESCKYDQYHVIQTIWSQATANGDEISLPLTSAEILDACLQPKHLEIRKWIFELLPEKIDLTSDEWIYRLFMHPDLNLESYQWILQETTSTPDPIIIFCRSLQFHKLDIAEWIYESCSIDLNESEIYPNAACNLTSIKWLWWKCKETGIKINFKTLPSDPTFQVYLMTEMINAEVSEWLESIDD